MPPGSKRPTMSVAERIFEEVQSLTEDEGRQVLEFVANLKTSHVKACAAQDVTIFDQSGAVYEGRQLADPSQSIK